MGMTRFGCGERAYTADGGRKRIRSRPSRDFVLIHSRVVDRRRNLGAVRRL